MKYLKVQEFTEDLEGEEVNLIGRLHQSRVKGKAGFLVIRDGFYTVQTTLFGSTEVSKGMLEWAKRIPKESIVAIKGLV